MTNEITWKQYDENRVTHSMGHYLMAIRDLLKARGYARVTDVATHLDISRSSASTSLASLRKKGLVLEDDNHFLRLSQRGESIALQIVRNHLILESFFRTVLGVDDEQALVDACKMEHLLSRETSMRLLALVQGMLNDEELLERARQRLSEQPCLPPSGEAERKKCPVCADDDVCPHGGIEAGFEDRPI